jgi:UDP-N-acetylmuramate--alanine ligase
MLLGPLTYKIRNIHLIGIGGAGMSGIAEILLNLGFTVSGSDMQATPVTDRLRKIGATVFIGHDPSNVAATDVVVYSSAVKEDNPEMKAARARAIPVIKRPEMLAELMRLKYGICIAGTHGKTTTTSMVAGALTRGGVDPTVIVGGKVADFGGGAKIGKSHFLVLEADEYDRTFLKLTPVIAVVTNIDADHLDCYRNITDIEEAFTQFVNKVPFFGSVILCIDDEGVNHIIPQVERKMITYGLDPRADYRAENVTFDRLESSFEVVARGKRAGVMKLQVPGIHNVRNALATVAVGLEMDVPFTVIADSLAEFLTVERRFQIIGEVGGIVLVDDYAHHPTEIAASLAGARAGFNRRIIAVFQPHLYSRTRDFHTDFGRALLGADLLYVTPIYPSREKPIEGINGMMVVDAARKAGHLNAVYVESVDGVPEELAKQVRPGDMVITFGAGDVNRVGYNFLNYLKSRG